MTLPPTVLTTKNAFPGNTVVPARYFASNNSDYIDVTNSSALNPASISVSCWVYWTGAKTPTNEQWFVGRDDASLGRAYCIGLTQAPQTLSMQINGGTVFLIDPGGGFTYNVWNNVSFTGSSASGYILYKNGVSVTSGGSGTAMSATTGSTTLGERTYSGDQGFLFGALSDIGIWNTILTPTQIAQLAGGARCNTVQSANLVGYWPITGASPEPDQSGNSNNGTLHGTVLSSGPYALA